MAWGSKERDWSALVSDIQQEISANRHILPPIHLESIQHYLDHGEYSMAFEYLYLEIMERPNSQRTLGSEKVREIALFFELNDENECMVDHRFWPKLEAYLD